MIITIQNNKLTAKIDTKGAELISLCDVDGVEYIWQKDPKYWARSSPVLFPVVGKQRNDCVVINKQEYYLSKNGFARDMEFVCVNQGVSHASFELRATEETLEQYPYQFILRLHYSLHGTKLEIHYDIVNEGSISMDFALGAHPAFCVPIGGKGSFETSYLEFEQKEIAACPVYDFEHAQIDMNHRVLRLDQSNHLPLRYQDFDQDALIFDQLKSNFVTLITPEFEKAIRVTFQDFDFLGVWTPIGAKAPFLCLEPWCGMASCSDESDDYSQKRGVKHLKERETKEFHLKIDLLDR